MRERKKAAERPKQQWTDVLAFYKAHEYKIVKLQALWRGHLVSLQLFGFYIPFVFLICETILDNTIPNIIKYLHILVINFLFNKNGSLLIYYLQFTSFTFRK